MGLKKIMRGFIPKCLPNAGLIGCLEVLRWWQRSFSARPQMNVSYAEEKQNVNEVFEENQRSLRAIPFGKYNLAYSGCEVIAVSNALIALKAGEPLKQLVYEFERDGILANGRFGTSPKAMRDFFVKKGYETIFSTKVNDFDRIGESYDSLILTFYNDKKDISKQVHSVNITKLEGKLYVHNLHCDGRKSGPYDTINQCLTTINGGQAKGISLIGIKY